VAIAIFAVIQSLIILFALKPLYPNDGEPVRVQRNAALEIVWTVAPAIILILTGLFTYRALLDGE
jgi:heme/copper-type cytochrome/quinol oxidase subunit 2